MAFGDAIPAQVTVVAVLVGVRTVGDAAIVGAASAAVAAESKIAPSATISAICMMRSVGVWDGNW